MIGLARRIARDVNSGFRHRIIYLASGGLTAVIYYGFVVAGLFILYGRAPYVVVVVAAHLVTVVIVYPWYRLVVFPGSALSWVGGYLRFYLAGLGW